MGSALINDCALCGRKKELQQSHIVPKLVIRYLKETSVGALRNMQNPNMTVQDGEKHYMLCKDCEELFGGYEKKFADTLFYPYMKDAARSFVFDSDLYYFLTSVSWRSIFLDILDFEEHPDDVIIHVDLLACLKARELSMRQYLLKTQPAVSGIEHHIFFADDIKESTINLPNVRPHVTMHRAIASYTFFNNELRSAATMTNMMGIFLFTLYSKGPEEKWVNTEIINSAGTISARKQEVQSFCINEMVDFLKRTERNAIRISDKQRKKIGDKLKAKMVEFKNSKVYEDLRKDFELFRE